MCLACEESDMYYRWQLLQQIAKGEMPEGHSEEDLRAMGLPLAGRNRGSSKSRTAPRSSGRRRRRRKPLGLCLRQPERMTELTPLTIAQARDGLKKKSFSAAELADAHIAAVEQARSLNAYVLETPDHARAQAQASDARIASGDAGPLEGIPIGVKDLFCTRDVRTTACSKILGNFVPPYESTVTAQLWRDGAVMLGKTNNDEFAMGSSNETSALGPVMSPWRRKGSNTRAGARRLVGRIGGGGRGAALSRRDRHRYRRLDPPAGGLHRHRRHQADLWPLFALGHRRLCLLARSGGAVHAHGARQRDPAALDGGPRSEGHHQRRPAGAGLRSRDRQIGERA